MANALEEALKRASEKDKQLLETGKSFILNAADAQSEATTNTKQPTLDPQTQSNIESIQQGQGNNYLYQNAIDRAQARTPQQSQKPTPEQDKER